MPPLSDSHPGANRKIHRFLWLATLGSEIAFWLALGVSYLLLGTDVQYGWYSPFLQDYVTHDVAYAVCERFVLLSIGALFLSILARINFGQRGEVVAPVLRGIIYLVFAALAAPAFWTAAPSA